ncbi:hypothetical protein QQ054_01020 [Oscillatoria amoena NRMC-F 0135]|nr:hypothetical protein [Oscillatoria amoena NRMC-F 0135]
MAKFKKAGEYELDKPTPEENKGGGTDNTGQETPTPTPNGGDVETVNLSDILAEETEVKKFTPVFGEDKDENQPPKGDDSDFENPPPPEPEQPPSPSEPQQKEADLTPRQNAELIVGTLDGLGQLIYPLAYKRKLFTPEERKELGEIKVLAKYIEKAGGDALYNSLTDLQKVVYQKYHTYKELCDEIPFEKNESDLIVKPLTKVFEKYNVGTGPEVALIMGIIMVTGSRIAPLLA